MDAMAAIRKTFFQECEEQLAELESGLIAMEQGDTDSERVNAVFRAVHSVKGGAGAFDLEDLVRFAHVFETALDEVRNERLAPEPHVLKVMLRAADVLADLVVAARDEVPFDEARSNALTEELVKLAGEGGHKEEEEDTDDEPFVFQPVQVDMSALMSFGDDDSSSLNHYNVIFTPKTALYANANEAAVLLRELGRVGEAKTTCGWADLPLLPDLDPEGAYLTWTIDLKTEKGENEIREVFEFVDGDCELDVQLQLPDMAEAPPLFAAEEPETEVKDEVIAPPVKAAPAAAPAPAPAAAPQRAEAAPPQAVAAAQATIRVDLDRVDRLINLVGELVINQAMLAQRVSEAGLARSSAVAEGLDELEDLSREIQESVMAIRAQPVKPVFQRMSRIVREVADATGKIVRLVTEGETTEVDKTVIERLTDPLTHMIRNAVDHGIESEEKRIAAGKPAEGTVRVSASHRSGRVVIEIADDGAGINRPRVREIAIRKGLIAADAQLTDDEIDNLIFLPGFSTAATISDISGRGVGMDVVKRSIQALGGRVFITSRPGLGSTFTMSLPLTLAVMDGMVLTVSDQTLVVPISAIVETLRPAAADIHGMGGDSRVVAIRNSFLPMVDVGQELGFRDEPCDPLSGVAMLVEADGGSRSVLLVDGIQGQRQVVIKSLEANYYLVPGIAAATILGDGRVALILDIDTLVAQSRSEGQRGKPLLEAAE